MENNNNLNEKQLKDKMFDKVKSLNLNELAKDVMPFLINLEEKIRVIDFEKYIINKINNKKG